MFAVVLASIGAVATSFAAGLRINLTGSIPPGVYQITHSPVVCGAIVLMCLPEPVAAFAKARGFIPRGSCTDGSAPIGKTVAAVAGDTIDVISSGIAVNGRALPNSRPLVRDSDNRPLPSLARGRYVAGTGTVWLVSSYSTRSFDSRYFGAVPVDHIIARIRPILQLP
ncbi:MAG TPA: conjugative transfer signal peptidase TraF, partial [Gemmatimonadaceae bacterium]|nr:conjugative transfer signal peptidase TraF [Gemmatimonadaceae bacterium]